MKCLNMQELNEGAEHPWIYFNAVEDGSDWRSVVNAKLCDKRNIKGTLFFANDYMDGILTDSELENRIKQERDVVLKADVNAFWFGKSITPSALCMFGNQLGRYCVGSGPVRLFVGMEEGNTTWNRDVFQMHMNVYNSNLNGDWKIDIASTLEDHIGNIHRYITSRY